MKELIVSNKQEKQRFDKYLMKQLPKAGSSFIYKMLRKKNITLNGKKAAGNEILNAGDVIKIFFSDETYEKFSNAHLDTDIYNRAFHMLKGVTVIYENDDLVFMNKPAGILSQSDDKGNLSLNEWLIGYCSNKGGLDINSYKPSVCNRIDRNTTGIVIGAKTYIGSRIITDAIRNHSLQKYYIARCTGIIANELSLKGYLVKDSANNKVKVYKNIKDIPDSLREEARIIETVVRPLSVNDGLTDAEIKLITGKSHQIRAHLASIGHPLLGDIKYGGRPTSEHGRQMLHAYKLIFPQDFEMQDLRGKEIECKPEWLTI